MKEGKICPYEQHGQHFRPYLLRISGFIEFFSLSENISERNHHPGKME